MFEDKIDGKVVVIGDTHGEFEATKRMLGWLAQNRYLDDRWVVFLGDYVDEGYETSKLLSLLISFKKYHQNTTFLAGNHDLNLAKALGIIKSPHENYYWNRIPQRNWSVLNSYDVKDGNELLLKMPDAHKDFLANLVWLVEHPDYLFVHSGFDPKESFEKQLDELKQRNPEIYKPKWLYANWIGYQGNSHQTEKRIFTGHINLNEVAAFDNRVMIDTGAGYGGSLTAMLLPEMEYVQIKTPKNFNFLLSDNAKKETAETA